MPHVESFFFKVRGMTFALRNESQGGPSFIYIIGV